MKIDGKAFKKAREQLRKEHADEEPLYGEPAIGTQQWLAEMSVVRTEITNGKRVDIHPTVRTIQNLENKGVASLNVIDAVSIPLKLNGRELILDYGISSVKCYAPRYLDFRPFYNLLIKPTEYYKTPFFVSIDPIVIEFDSNDLDEIVLESMSLKLSIDNKEIEFDWIYVVLLIPGQPWLGIQEGVSKKTLRSPEKLSYSIMFNQRNVDDLEKRVIWSDFIDLLEITKQNHLRIIVTLNFTYFKKELKIMASINEIRNLFDFASKKYSDFYEKYNLKHPRFFQPSALTW